MSKADFAGHFSFRRTDSGNLLGEYSNKGEGCTVNTECANRIEESKTIDVEAEGDGYANRGEIETGKTESPIDMRIDDGFSGNYHSCWLEGTQAEVANLKIKSIGGKAFEVIWTELQTPQKMRFTGKAFVTDGILVGSYVYAK